MTKTFTTLLLVLFFTFRIVAQSDTLQIEEIIISANRTPLLYGENARIVSIISKIEIENAPVSSLQALLEMTLNADIRQRGANGMQADISIRGGSFDQTLILLNGVNISDTQTGHHSLNLPVDMADIERIEVLEGAGARIYGTNAFSGAINIITRISSQKEIRAKLIAGEHNFYQTRAAISYPIGKIQNNLGITYKTTDGYITNTDFKSYQAFYQGKLPLRKLNLNLQAGYADKAFGANSFYTPKYPNQFEQTKVLFANLQMRSKGKVKLISNFYWRRHQDRFELFRNRPAAWYKGHNYHLTHTYGFSSNLHFNSQIGRTAIGLEIRNELIMSNKLGDLLEIERQVPGEIDGVFTKSKSRLNGNIFIEQSYSYKRFFVSGGVSANWNSSFAWNFSPGFDAAFRVADKLKLFASVNHSVRLPTFTDLYYVGATNIGNTNLKPEQAVSTEIGLKYLSRSTTAHVAVFRRFGSNIIDWVKSDSDSKWESKNITQLITSGVELSVNQRFTNGFVRFNYAYISTDKESNSFISKYALDYLKHKFSFVFQHKIYSNFFASFRASVQDRAGTFALFDTLSGESSETEYDVFTTVDARLSWRNKKMEIFIDATNLLNKPYYDLGNVAMPGRWIKAGVKLKLNL